MTDPQPADTIVPEVLIAALRDAGWTPAGGRTGVYMRLNWPETVDGRPRSTLIPLAYASGYADYHDHLTAAIDELKTLARLGALATRVLDQVLDISDVHVVWDGDTVAVECFAAGPEHPHTVHTITPRQPWPTVAGTVAGHRCPPGEDHRRAS